MEKLGVSISQVARNFIASPEFRTKYGSLNTTDYVRQLYRNVLGRDADADGLRYHVDRIDQQGVSRQDVLIGFSESPEKKIAVAPEMAGGITMKERVITTSASNTVGGAISGCNYTDRVGASNRALGNSCGIQVSAFVAQADLRLQMIIQACRAGNKAAADREYNDQYDKIIRVMHSAFEATSCGNTSGTGVSTDSGGTSGFGTNLVYHVCTRTSGSASTSLEAAMGGTAVIRVEAECAGASESTEERFCHHPEFVFRQSYSSLSPCESGARSLRR